MHEARYWEVRGDRIVCRLCPHFCRVAAGQVGLCGVRRHRDGRLWATAYGRVSALALDPVEKKPLFHFKPGSQVYSVGSAGCNFHCGFCQNWTISQAQPPLTSCAPAELVAQARAAGAVGVAYTYNEPLVNFEYVADCARLVRQAGLANVVVTNGFIAPEPRDELLPWIDAWNIDLKAIRPDFYRRVCGGQLEPVQATIRAAAAVGHVELTNLVVTESNDSLEEIAELVDWVASVSTEIPLHFSRYFPQYRWDAPPTSTGRLAQAVSLARERLAWVYAGNLPGQDDSTYCPDCRERLITRQGYRVGSVKLVDGQCPRCQRKVPGVF